MPTRRLTPFVAVLAVALAGPTGCVVTVGSASPVAARAEREIEESLQVSRGDRLRVLNLAGSAVIGRAEGDRLTVRATVMAGGDDEAEAEMLADGVELRIGTVEGEPAITVVYPVREYTNFHYDGQQESGIASWFGGSNSRFDYLDERVSVSTSRRSGAATLHANLEIGVPEGVGLHLLNAVGRVRADDVPGDLTMVVHSGRIHSVGGTGALMADTGSGSVEVEDRSGSVVVDTGSGSVIVRRVIGEVRVDTGSGGVTVEDVQGSFVGVDTGSGSVDLRRVSAAIDVDTGSGSVSGEELVVGERLRVDTGSGRIRLAGDFAALSRGEVDTGSGGVTLRMSGWPSMRLDLRTSSGGIDVELPDVRATRSERNSFRGEVGENPQASLTVSTSSGGIRISDE